MSKKLKHRYPAFTILELMVVMLLTVLTISLAFRVYEMFTKMFLQYKRHAYRMTELTSFQRVLSKDINRAEGVVRITEGLRCSFGLDSVEYKWGENFITRHSLKVDTFHIEVLHSSYVYESYEQYLDEAPVELYTALIRSDKDSLTLCFGKQYGADQKLRYREKYGYQENSAR